MAKKRMFNMDIVDTDMFLDMPASSQNLYFHLGMRADDDGFVSNPNKIIKTIGASRDDLKILKLKKYILEFDSGIIVITQWRLNNYLRNDRYTPTIYQAEKDLLNIDTQGNYEFGIPGGIPVVYLDKNSIEKSSLEENSKDKTRLEEFREDEEEYSTDLVIVKTEKDLELEKSITGIVDYLNMKANTSYKPNTAKTQSLIKARLKEGYTLNDFKIVIDKKVAEWVGTEWERYLKPDTLFGNKFEGYLNQKVTNKQEANKNNFADLRNGINEDF